MPDQPQQPTATVDDFALNAYEAMAAYSLTQKVAIRAALDNLIKSDIDSAIKDLQALKGSL